MKNILEKTAAFLHRHKKGIVIWMAVLLLPAALKVTWKTSDREIAGKELHDQQKTAVHSRRKAPEKPESQNTILAWQLPDGEQEILISIEGDFSYRISSREVQQTEQLPKETEETESYEFASEQGIEQVTMKIRVDKNGTVTVLQPAQTAKDAAAASGKAASEETFWAADTGRVEKTGEMQPRKFLRLGPLEILSGIALIFVLYLLFQLRMEKSRKQKGISFEDKDFGSDKITYIGTCRREDAKDAVTKYRIRREPGDEKKMSFLEKVMYILMIEDDFEDDDFDE